MNCEDKNPEKQLILKEHQNNHVKRILKILETKPGFIDASPTGSGKTFTTLYIAKKLNLKVFVICPPIVQSNWRDNCILHGVEYVEILSYQGLRSIKNHQPSHEYLTRDDNSKKEPVFRTELKFDELIDKGILLILDEAQNLKNNCDQYRACKQLCKKIQQVNVDFREKININPLNFKVSKFCLLSGSLFDKKKHVLQFLELSGLLPSIGDRKKLAFNDFVSFFQYCMSIDKNNTKKFFENSNKDLSIEEIILTVYELFVNIVRPLICSSMPPPKELFIKTMKSGFFNMITTDGNKLANEVNNLCKSLGYNDELDEIQNKSGLGGVVTALKNIETIKKPIFIENAKRILESNKKAKVIICLNYRDNIFDVADSLKKYNPGVLIGGISMMEKDKIKYLFQTDDKYRLIIMTTCLSVGINLHDTTGERPRTMFISPLHNVSHIHQAAGRIIRCDTSSATTVCLVYGKAALKETSIINALCRKTEVLKELHVEQVENGVIFPADYAKFFEKDP